MTAGRAAVLAGLLLAGATCLRAAAQVEADPHELYQSAREQLTRGQLQEASTSLARLHALIAGRPDWDPDGAFAKELLPPLLARLKRLEGAARKLDDFSGQALEGLKPPDIKDDMSTVKDYTHWATSVIQRLRSQRDGVISSTLTDPEERALLARTESYMQTERLLEVDVLKRMAEEAGDDILGLLSGDPNLESVLVRFRQLKQELMQSMAQRDQMERRVNESGERTRNLLRVLTAVVTDDAPLQDGTVAGKPRDVAVRFAHFLDGEREALRHRPSLTTSERDVLLASLDRYGKYNQVLTAAGLGSDQRERVDTLTQAVADIPIRDGAAPLTPGRAFLLLIGGLAFCAGFLAGLAFVRGRRLAPLQRPRGDIRSGATLVDAADADRDAA